MSLGSGRCHYHPERSGLGICVECRNVICSECTTQFEGINRCAKCLAARLEQVHQSVARNDWSMGGVLVAVLSLAVLYAGFFGLATALTR